MSWVTVIWSMTAAACITLALVHLVVWLMTRKVDAHLMFFVAAVSVAAFAGAELAMMRARTPQELGTLMRWAHVSAWLIILSLIGFVRLYLRAGRPWLAWGVAALRTLALVLNFIFTPNLNYRAITEVREIQFLGEGVSVAVARQNPWMIVAQAGLLLFIVYVVDATLTAWRRGERRRSLVGGSIIVFAVAGSVESVLVLWGVVAAPITASVFYMAIVVVLACELAADIVRSLQLMRDLQLSRSSLGESERRFQLVVELAPNAIVAVDEQGRIVLVNKAIEEIFGYARSELVGQSIETLVPDGIRQRHPGLRQAYIAVPELRAMGAGRELFGRRKDGQKVPVEIGLSPVRTPQGTLVLASIVDITERRREERAAAKQRNELAHLSRVAMLGELSGSMAHELNQPLTAILTNAEAAQLFARHEDADMGEIRKILSDIGSAARRAGEIIQRLRLLLKKGEVLRQELEINELAQEVLKLMRSDLINHHVLVETDFADGLPLVMGDRVQLQQVLINLITNACDAMAGTDEAQRVLKVQTQAGGTEAVRISVRDRGVGIPAKDLEAVFESFHTSKPRGMGLGLSVCRSIVSAHQGQIIAANNAQGGACFHVVLPAGATVADARPPVDRSEPSVQVMPAADVTVPV